MATHSIGGTPYEVSLAQTTIGRMLANIHDARIQQQSCATLAKRAITVANRQMVAAQLGGVDAVVRVMHAHMHDSAVCKQALRCLSLFAVDDTRLIFSLDGVQTVVDAMAAHADNQAVTEQAVACLSDLAVDAATRVEIAAAGGIACLISAATAFGCANETLACHCCLALARLATDAGSRKLIVAQSVAPLAAVLTAHTDNDQVVAACLAAFAVFATDSEAHRELLDRAARAIFGVLNHVRAAANIELSFRLLLHLADRPAQAIKVLFELCSAYACQYSFCLRVDTTVR